jgi:DNA-binding CsgD family transcriptional regulator
MPPGESLLGRSGEEAAIGALLSDARAGRGGAIVLVGEPGIGKTALIAHARAAATRVSMRVLEARGVESESAIPFGALATLLRPELSRLETLPDRQRAALAGALAVGPPAPGDPLTIGAATLGVLAAVADDGPLLVLVDDAHWIDDASASALLFAARRLEHDPVAAILAARPDEGTPLPLDGLDALRVAGLERPAAAALLAQANPALAAPEVERALALSAGNPLGLIELARLPDGLAVDPAGLPPAVGPAVEEAFSRRVHVLPADARRALLIAAIGEAERLEVLQAAAARLGVGLDALEPAEAAGLVELGPDSVRFRHPLVRAAAYHAATAPDRRSVHGAFAAVLDGDASGLRRAWHLAGAAVGPDAHAASALDAAAAHARQRHGLAAAAAALERAARLTPAGAERARRLVAAAADRILSGATADGLALLEEASADAAAPGLRAAADALRGRAEVLQGSLITAHELLAGAADRLREHDARQAALLMLEAAVPCFMAGRLELALATARRASELAEAVGGDVRALAALELGGALAITGHERERAEALIAANAYAMELPEFLLSPAGAAGMLEFHVWLERYADGLRVAERARELAEAAGAQGAIPIVLAARCGLEYRIGDWVAARAHGTESVRLAEATGQAMQAAFPLNALARLDAARGREASAMELSGRALEIAGRSGMESMEVYGLSALSLLDLGAGRPEAAAERLLLVREACERFGMHDPSVVQWRPDLVEALLRCGREDDARAEAAAYAAQANGTARPNVRATVARLAGLLAEDEDEAQERFAEAMSWHARGADPFERARTQLAAGERGRRARRATQAREPLRAALATFEALGAEPWARRARTELRAAGGSVAPARPGRTEELTGQELEVALLVSTGASNREVAASLLLSVRTVEVHLSRVYRKLGLRGRTELAALMARGSGAAFTAPSGRPTA